MKTIRPLVVTMVLILVTALTACATSDFLPKSQWARFDGHDVDLIEFDDYTSRYQIVALDAHDIDNRFSARTATEGISCLRLDCRLYPGSHTIEIAYRWVESDIDKKRRRSEALKGVGYMALTLLGALSGAGIPDGPSPTRDPASTCFATLTFEVQARHHYIMVFVDTDQQVPPEEVRIIEVDSGDVTISSSPLC